MALLSSGPRTVGVDFGTKRVGLALADPLGFFARPHGTYTRKGAVEALRAMRDAEGIELIVIGWPLEEDGTEGKATERVQQYVNRLRNALPGVEIERWDERYTSERAKEKLKEAGIRWARRGERERVDAAAAALILQDYLEARG